MAERAMIADTIADLPSHRPVSASNEALTAEGGRPASINSWSSEVARALSPNGDIPQRTDLEPSLANEGSLTPNERHAFRLLAVDNLGCQRGPNLGQGRELTLRQMAQSRRPPRRAVYAWTEPSEGGAYRRGATLLKSEQGMPQQGLRSDLGDFSPKLRPAPQGRDLLKSAQISIAEFAALRLHPHAESVESIGKFSHWENFCSPSLIPGGVAA